MSWLLSNIHTFAAGCNANGFLGFPKWYKYLPHEDVANQKSILGGSPQTVCNVRADSLSDIGPILAAVVEILLRISALVAVIFVIVGGVKYITSQGEPERLKQALGTIVNALIGLVIAITATAFITFIGGRFN